MDFAERLKELRDKRGYTQAELADKLHVSKSTISMLEVGARKPSFELLEEIGDFFNVDTDYLRGRESGSTYYLDPEAAEMAKEVFQREELRVLFDTVKDVSKEDIETVIRMVKGLMNE